MGGDWRCGGHWGFKRERLLGCSMAFGHGKAQDVTEHTGIPSGDRPRGFDEVGCEDWLRTHYLAQGREPPRVRRRRSPGRDETIDLAPGKPNLDPNPRLGERIEFWRNGILEFAVEVREPAVHDYGRDRQRWCQHCRPRPISRAHEGNLAAPSVSGSVSEMPCELTPQRHDAC